MHKPKFLRASVAISISSALVLAPVAANAATASSSSSAGAVQNVSSFSPSLTASDWRKIARQASIAGDATSAQAATAMAAKSTGSKNLAQPANVITALAKKAAIAALRFGTDKIPAKLRPYAHKIANFLEDLENWQEGPIITGLMALGVPYDVASGVATWVVIVGGV